MNTRNSPLHTSSFTPLLPHEWHEKDRSIERDFIYFLTKESLEPNFWEAKTFYNQNEYFQSYLNEVLHNFLIYTLENWKYENDYTKLGDLKKEFPMIDFDTDIQNTFKRFLYLMDERYYYKARMIFYILWNRNQSEMKEYLNQQFQNHLNESNFDTIISFTKVFYTLLNNCINNLKEKFEWSLTPEQNFKFHQLVSEIKYTQKWELDTFTTSESVLNIIKNTSSFEMLISTKKNMEAKEMINNQQISENDVKKLFFSSYKCMKTDLIQALGNIFFENDIIILLKYVLYNRNNDVRDMGELHSVLEVGKTPKIEKEILDILEEFLLLDKIEDVCRFYKYFKHLIPWIKDIYIKYSENIKIILKERLHKSLLSCQQKISEKSINKLNLNLSLIYYIQENFFGIDISDFSDEITKYKSYL